MAKSERGDRRTSVSNNIIEILKNNRKQFDDGSSSGVKDIPENLIVDLVIRFSQFIDSTKPLKDRQLQIFKQRQDKPTVMVDKEMDGIKLNDGSVITLKEDQDRDMKTLGSALDALSSILATINKPGHEKVIEELQKWTEVAPIPDRRDFLREKLDEVIGKNPLPGRTFEDLR